MMFAFRTLGRSVNTILPLLLSAPRRLENSPFPISSPNPVPPLGELEGFEFGVRYHKKMGLLVTPLSALGPNEKTQQIRYGV